jgi:hypothetical protein
MVKVNVKVKGDKYLGMEGVIKFYVCTKYLLFKF